jgi:hypothetical protein
MTSSEVKALTDAASLIHVPSAPPLPSVSHLPSVSSSLSSIVGGGTGTSTGGRRDRMIPLAVMLRDQLRPLPLDDSDHPLTLLEPEVDLSQPWPLPDSFAHPDDEGIPFYVMEPSSMPLPSPSSSSSYYPTVGVISGSPLLPQPNQSSLPSATVASSTIAPIAVGGGQQLMGRVARRTTLLSTLRYTWRRLNRRPVITATVITLSFVGTFHLLHTIHQYHKRHARWPRGRDMQSPPPPAAAAMPWHESLARYLRHQRRLIRHGAYWPPSIYTIVTIIGWWILLQRLRASAAQSVAYLNAKKLAALSFSSLPSSTPTVAIPSVTPPSTPVTMTPSSLTANHIVARLIDDLPYS